MGRSLRVSEEGLKKAKEAFKRAGWTQDHLAGRADCTRQTVHKFLNGRDVEKRIFEAICGELKLTVGEIADFESEEEQLSKSLGSNGSSVQTLQGNTSESSQERCGNMDVLTEPVAETKEQNQTYEERLAFAIAGSVSKVDIQKLKAIVGVLQKITGDTSLEIVDIEKGSIRLILEGSQESLEQIEALFKSGQLTEVEGFRVEDVQFVNPKNLEHEVDIKAVDKKRLAFTIAGGISLEEIQELKTVFTKNSDKDEEIETGDKACIDTQSDEILDDYIIQKSPESTDNVETADFGSEFRENQILCCYVNATSSIQIARITNIPNWYFERVVFPGQRLVFESLPQAILEIHTGMMASAILADSIPCDRLAVDDSKSVEPKKPKIEKVVSNDNQGFKLNKKMN
jgi:DNA-binding XRE family transcriptional regulator